MPAWSYISCPYWIGVERPPGRPVSVSGVRPDITTIGTSSEAALMTPIAAFASPTLTCTITA